MKRPAALVWALALLAAASSARAQTVQPTAEAGAPPAVPSRPLAEAVVLDEGATCLDQERLVRRIARWLQRDRVDATLRVDVQGDPQDPHRVRFAIDRDGDRALRTINDGPADCDQLHAALALSIALAIDANLGLGDVPNPDLPDDEALVEGKPPPPQYFKLGAALLLHATSGLLTDISAGASARVEAGFVPWLDLRLGAFGSSIDDQTIPDVTEGTFSASLFAGRADGCFAHGLGKLRLMACAGVMAGVFSAKGDHFSGGGQSDPLPWAAVLGGFELQAELAPWLSLAAAVDLVVPFGTRRIQVVDMLGHPTRPRTLTSVAVLVGAGPVLRFF